MEVIFGQKIVRNGIFVLFLGVLLIYCPYALKSYKFVKNLYFLRILDKKSLQWPLLEFDFTWKHVGFWLLGQYEKSFTSYA